MSVQVGAHYLEKAQGGAGILLGGVPGVKAANVVVIGGGISGTHAVRMALGMEAIVTVIDKNRSTACASWTSCSAPASTPSIRPSMRSSSM